MGLSCNGLNSSKLQFSDNSEVHFWSPEDIEGDFSTKVPLLVHRGDAIDFAEIFGGGKVVRFYHPRPKGFGFIGV